MKRILPMVIKKVDLQGIWFRGTKDGYQYVFWWNPIRTMRNLINGNFYMGFFPFLTKHIKGLK